MSEQESTIIKKYIFKDEKENNEENKDKEENDENKENQENKDKEENKENNSENFDDGIALLKGEDLDNLKYYGFAVLNIFYNETKQEITNIQITYRNSKNKKEKILIPMIKFPESSSYDEIPERFKLKKNEYVKNFSFRRNGTKLTQINVETNKNRKFIVGKDDGELIELKKDDKNDIILAIFGTLSNIGIYYFKIDSYIKMYCSGMSELKLKLDKNEEYKKQIQDKYQSLPEIDKYIYKTALLPKNPFLSILKYIICELRYNN